MRECRWLAGKAYSRSRVVRRFVFLYFGQGFEILFDTDRVLVLIGFSGVRFINLEAQFVNIHNQFLHFVAIFLCVHFPFNISKTQRILFRLYFLQFHNLRVVLELAENYRRWLHLFFLWIIIQTYRNFIVAFSHRNFQVTLWKTLVAWYTHELCVFSWSPAYNIRRRNVYVLWCLIWSCIYVQIAHFSYDLLCHWKAEKGLLFRFYHGFFLKFLWSYKLVPLWHK